MRKIRDQPHNQDDRKDRLLPLSLTRTEPHTMSMSMSRVVAVLKRTTTPQSITSTTRLLPASFGSLPQRGSVVSSTTPFSALVRPQQQQQQSIQPIQFQQIVRQQQLQRGLSLPPSPFRYGDLWNDASLQCMNRNARKPRKANHGKRPCSRQSRRAKRNAYGNHRR